MGSGHYLCVTIGKNYMNTCIVCKTQGIPTSQGGGMTSSFYTYDCPRCGKFSLSDTCNEDIHALTDTHTKRRVLSHALRKMYKNNKIVSINDYGLLKNILETTTLPNPAEQANNLLLYLGNVLSSIGSWKESVPIEELAGVMGCLNDSPDVLSISTHLEQKGLIRTQQLGSKKEGVPTGKINLTFEGWEKFNELQYIRQDSRKAFMAMDFNQADIQTVFNAYKKAVKQTGFELIKLNDVPKAGIIDDRLRVEIRKARFLIVDLTHGNRGAYWEAGFGEGLGKEVIYSCEKDVFEEEKTHFDTNHLHTVLWKIDDLQTATEELKATIRNTLSSEAILED